MKNNIKRKQEEPLEEVPFKKSRQRNSDIKRLNEGWKRLNVWVPKKEAELIKHIMDVHKLKNQREVIRFLLVAFLQRARFALNYDLEV